MTQEPATPATAIDVFVAYITQALIAECGEKHRRKIERCIEKKHAAILADLTQVYFSWARHSWFASNPDIKIMRSKAMEVAWGRIQIDGKQYWLNALLSRYLFTTLHEGSKARKTVSAVQFTKPIVVNAIHEYVGQQKAVPLPAAKVVEDDKLKYSVTAINLPSLRHYMADLIRQLSTKSYVAAFEKHLVRKILSDEDAMDRIVADKRHKLEHNLYYASAIANSVNDKGELWQEANESAAGRTYLKGINLQSASKEVRHAALGYSVVYDLRCGALGVMAALANFFSDGEWKFHAIKDYIKNRKEIRQAITRSIYVEAKSYTNIEDFYGYYKVKDAFTAIGFGARKTVGGSWINEAGKWKTSSLKEILGNHVEAFLSHRLAKDIIAEYELAAKVVLAAYKLNDEFRDYLNENSRFDPAMTSKQLLAHVYQHFESVILDQFVGGAAQQGATLLLPLHDGAYFNRAVDHRSIWWMMRLPFIWDKLFIQFERTEYVSQTVKDTCQQKVSEHKAFMRLQEKAVVDYASRYASACEV